MKRGAGMLPRDCSSNSDTEFFVQHAFCKAGGAPAGPPNAARTNTAGTPFAGKAAQPDGCSGQHDGDGPKAKFFDKTGQHMGILASIC